MRTLVILGTARADSNTLKAVEEICPLRPFEVIDLGTFDIRPYDYDHAINEDDDFLKIASMMANADNIVFATPVYWYAMSGSLKTFFDRLTELLSTHKTLGKSLKGKKTYLIATGTDTELPPGFETPFRLTSEYFNMTYSGAFYKQCQ